MSGPEDRPFGGLSPHDVGEGGWRKLPARAGSRRS